MQTAIGIARHWIVIMKHAVPITSL